MWFIDGQTYKMFEGIYKYVYMWMYMLKSFNEVVSKNICVYYVFVRYI